MTMDGGTGNNSTLLQPSLGDETWRDLEDHERPVPGDHPAPAAAVNLEDAGPPDGGAAAWLVVLGAWCCSFSSSGWINSVGSFQQYYEVGPLKNYPESTISWIPSLQLFFMFALGPVVGMVFDGYGPRPLILGGTLLHVFGLVMASLATTYYRLTLSRGVWGGGAAPSVLRVSTRRRSPASRPGSPGTAGRPWASW